MHTMTSHERFTRMFEHKEADRVAMWDFPWPGAQSRWYNEGMPRDTDYTEYFGVDRVSRIVVDNSPRMPIAVVEENDRFITMSTSWGAHERNFKHEDSTPEYVSYAIHNRDDWAKAKARMTPDPDRVPWAHLQENYRTWRERGDWILADTAFGVSLFYSAVVGTEDLLMALVEDPEWCLEMTMHSVELNIQLLDMAWDKGYTFDMINVRDDLGFSYSQFFSLSTFRDIVLPAYRRIVDWAHAKGAWARLHSCGSIKPFLPDIVAVGYDALHPMERKAGMDPVAIKKEFGDRLVLHGGINAMLWKDIDAVKAEMDAIVPVCKQSGGYIFAADHSIPNDVSFQNICEIIRYAKELGKY